MTATFVGYAGSGGSSVDVSGTGRQADDLIVVTGVNNPGTGTSDTTLIDWDTVITGMPNGAINAANWKLLMGDPALGDNATMRGRCAIAESATFATAGNPTGKHVVVTLPAAIGGANGVVFQPNLSELCEWATMEYDIMYASGNLGKGGKSPGFGWKDSTLSEPPSGGHPSPHGGGDRLMWLGDSVGGQPNGSNACEMIAYEYRPLQDPGDFGINRHSQVTVGPEGGTPDAVKRHVKFEQKLNSVGSHATSTPPSSLVLHEDYENDGLSRLFINGVQKYGVENDVQRLYSAVKISDMQFDFFFGGATTDWAGAGGLVIKIANLKFIKKAAASGELGTPAGFTPVGADLSPFGTDHRQTYVKKSNGTETTISCTNAGAMSASVWRGVDIIELLGSSDGSTLSKDALDGGNELMILYAYTQVSSAGTGPGAPGAPVVERGRGYAGAFFGTAHFSEPAVDGVIPTRNFDAGVSTARIQTFGLYLTPPPGPGVPTGAHAEDVTQTTADVLWSAPTSGGELTGYEARFNGGGAVSISGPGLKHHFTGLTPDTVYATELQIRSVGPDGNSAWVSVPVTTGPQGVIAPWPVKMAQIHNDSIVGMTRDDDTVTLLTRGGEEILSYDVQGEVSFNYGSIALIGAFDTGYREKVIRDWYRPTFPNKRLDDATVLPDYTVYDLSWSPDAKYLAVAKGDSASPYEYVMIYKRSGDVLTKLATPATQPPSIATSVDWTKDGQYLAVGHGTSPYFSVYKRSGDVLTKLANPAQLPAITVQDVAWSPDGIYLAITQQANNQVTIYKRSGDVLTRLVILTVISPGNMVNNLGWSSNGKYLSMGVSTTAGASVAPNLVTYKRTGDSFTMLPDTTPAQLGVVSDVGWSPDSQYLAVLCTGAQSPGPASLTPKLYLYKRSEDVLTRVATAAPEFTWNVSPLCWSPDGRYIAVGGTHLPQLQIWRRSGDALDLATELLTDAGDYMGSDRSIAWSPDGQLVAFAADDFPFFVIHKSADGPLSGPAARTQIVP